MQHNGWIIKNIVVHKNANKNNSIILNVVSKTKTEFAIDFIKTKNKEKYGSLFGFV